MFSRHLALFDKRLQHELPILDLKQKSCGRISGCQTHETALPVESTSFQSFALTLPPSPLLSAPHFPCSATQIFCGASALAWTEALRGVYRLDPCPSAGTLRCAVATPAMVQPVLTTGCEVMPLMSLCLMLGCLPGLLTGESPTTEKQPNTMRTTIKIRNCKHSSVLNNHKYVISLCVCVCVCVLSLIHI